MRAITMTLERYLDRCGRICSVSRRSLRIPKISMSLMVLASLLFIVQTAADSFPEDERLKLR